MCGASPWTVSSESAGRRDPAGMPAHDLENEYLRRRLRHGQDVERGFLGRYGDILGDRTEARAVVRYRQIVVDGLRDTQALHGETHLAGDLRHLVGGIHGVVAAVVEEVADVMRAEHLDEASRTPARFSSMPLSL